MENIEFKDALAETRTWRQVSKELSLSRVSKERIVLDCLFEKAVNSRRHLLQYIRDARLQHAFVSFSQKDANQIASLITQASDVIRESVWEKKLPSTQKVGFRQNQPEESKPSQLLVFVRELKETDLDIFAAVAVYDYGFRNQVISQMQAWFDELKSAGLIDSASPIKNIEDLKTAHCLLEKAVFLCGPIWIYED